MPFKASFTDCYEIQQVKEDQDLDTLPVETSRCLVALLVFKTGGAEDLGAAGSIPVRLRCLS